MSIILIFNHEFFGHFSEFLGHKYRYFNDFFSILGY